MNIFIIIVHTVGHSHRFMFENWESLTYVKIKKILKIGTLFIVFVIFAFLISLLIFTALDKYNLFHNRATSIISNLLSVIIGILVIQFLIRKTY